MKFIAVLARVDIQPACAVPKTAQFAPPARPVGPGPAAAVELGHGTGTVPTITPRGGHVWQVEDPPRWTRSDVPWRLNVSTTWSATGMAAGALFLLPLLIERPSIKGRSTIGNQEQLAITPVCPGTAQVSGGESPMETWKRLLRRLFDLPYNPPGKLVTPVCR